MKKIIKKNTMNELNENTLSNVSKKKLNIKHLVLSGGGQAGFTIYGALLELFKKKVIDLNNIESFYSTSAGAFISVMICLKLSEEDIVEYFLNRPWENIFPVQPSMVFEVYKKKGLYDGKFVNEIFKPLFGACDLPMNITLKEFYEYTQKEHHFFAVDLNTFELNNISYKTFPDLSLIHALQMTSAIPYLIQPVIYEDKCYIDGGIIMNYPVKPCLEEKKCLETEVLGLKAISLYNDNPTINKNSTLLDLTYSFLFHIKNNLQYKNNDQYKIITIDLPFEGIKISSLREVICSKESRTNLLNKGNKIAQDFITDLKQ